MKTNLILFSLLIFLCAACDDSDYDYDYASFSLSNGYNYADQTVDSLTIQALDSWTVTLEDSWLSLESDSSVLTYSSSSSYTYTTVPIYMEPNTTGSTRYGTINIKVDKTSSGNIIQYGWLNITRPSRILVSNSSDIYSDIYDDEDDQQREFILSAEGDETTDSLTFTIYASTATLSTSDTWITPSDTTVTTGTHTIPISFSTNYDETRKATYTLTTSNGVTSTIYVYQQQAYEN